MTNYDYIVIGAGSAGCVVANRLTEDCDTTVLLLEAGNLATKPEIQIPAQCFSLIGSEVDWGYFSEPEPYLNYRKMFCSRGKVLGGSSSINFMMYIRGNPQDYDRWQELGNPGWSYQEVLPYFKKSEHQQQGASEFHGVDGELSVTDLMSPAVVSQRFVDACVSMGYNYNPDFNGVQQEGVGFYQLTVKDGKRHSAAAAFLLPILHRPNLTVITGALVTRLLVEGTRCVGVEYLHEDTLHQVRVNQEVILSAGAFDSPKLLMLSGIGTAEHLQAMGISVVVDLPGVGQNLQDHVLTCVVQAATQDIHPAITSNGIEAGLFLHSKGNVEAAPDLQFFFGPIQFLSPGYTPADFGFTGAVSLTRLQNIGGVTLRPAEGSSADARRLATASLTLSPDPKDPPTIRMNYLQSQADVQKLVEGVKLIRQLIQTSAFDDFHSEEIAPGSHVQSNAALEAYIRDTCSTVWHPVGTCKMGIDPMAVVDPELRVYGVKGLRVVDASIMPTITTGNTNAPTIMIGEKAADLIKAERTLQIISDQFNVPMPTRSST
ncbi:GMC family oxidoreductase [Nostoc sp.]|uniref:GMC family oxidoreductase n=1 Tax=Nostoc sp. TaxID=1180 RepID=UPI002FFC7D53